MFSHSVHTKPVQSVWGTQTCAHCSFLCISQFLDYYSAIIDIYRLQLHRVGPVLYIRCKLCFVELQYPLVPMTAVFLREQELIYTRIQIYMSVGINVL